MEKSITMTKMYGVTEDGDLVAIMPNKGITIVKESLSNPYLWNDIIMTLEGNIEQYTVADSVGDKFEEMLSKVIDTDIQALERIKFILDRQNNT